MFRTNLGSNGLVQVHHCGANLGAIVKKMLKHILVIRNHNSESASEQNLTSKQVKLCPVAVEKYTYESIW